MNKMSWQTHNNSQMLFLFPGYLICDILCILLSYYLETVLHIALKLIYIIHVKWGIPVYVDYHHRNMLWKWNSRLLVIIKVSDCCYNETVILLQSFAYVVYHLLTDNFVLQEPIVAKPKRNVVSALCSMCRICGFRCDCTEYCTRELVSSFHVDEQACMF